jgi:CheY-like chemotaxis protein
VSTRGKRILLVDDDASYRVVMAHGLRERGYVVTEASSAEEALELLGADPCDLLLTDYRLGGATGTWLARVAARTGLIAPTQILIVTGYRELADADGLAVLRKPVAEDELVLEIEQALARPCEKEAEVPEPSQRISLTLYVSDSIPSSRASRNMRALLGDYRSDQIALTTVNVAHHTDHHAEEDRIMVTPTLLKTFPRPRVWIVGDLARRDVVERLLEQAGVERAS